MKLRKVWCTATTSPRRPWAFFDVDGTCRQNEKRGSAVCAKTPVLPHRPAGGWESDVLLMQALQQKTGPTPSLPSARGTPIACFDPHCARGSVNLGLQA